MSRYEMSNLVEEVLGALSGYTQDQPQMTWLTSDIDGDELSLPVDDPGQVSRGVVEVGDELVFAWKTDTSGVTLAPFGRGYQGTARREWPTNTRVTQSPRFPRAHIRETINDVIRGTYPMLFAVDSIEFAPDTLRATYELPAGAEDILTVKQKSFGVSQFEHTLTRYGINKDGPTPTIDILQGVNTTEPIRVTYLKKPISVATDGTFTDSGLSVTAWPAIKYGALFQLISPQESGTSGLHAVKASEAKGQRNVSATGLGRQYYAVYQQLLLEERQRLLSEHEIVNNKELF